MIKKIFILLIIAHALTQVWVLFSTKEHHFISGYPTGLNEQWFVKGFFDLLLRATYSGVICLLMRQYFRDLALFFYVTFVYYFCNMVLYWYNFCQWHWPYYVMMAGLVGAALWLWPKEGKMKVVR